MQDGVKFFLSKNNVILSAGINGVISREYFSFVYEKINKERKLIYQNSSEN